jgi:hypothetical protein
MSPAYPQSQWLAATSLDALAMSKIIKPVRPFVVVRNEEARFSRVGQSLNCIDRKASGAFRSGLSQGTLGDLGHLHHDPTSDAGRCGRFS